MDIADGTVPKDFPFQFQAIQRNSSLEKLIKQKIPFALDPHSRVFMQLNLFMV